MSYAPPVHSDSALYTGSPFNTNLNASPGVLVLGGDISVSVPTGLIEPGATLGLDANNRLIKGSEVSGAITGGAVGPGGVIATVDTFATVTNGWKVGDTGNFGNGSFNGSGATFTVSGVSAGLVAVSNISPANLPGFQINTNYTLPGGGATVTLLMSSATVITDMVIVSPGVGYVTGLILTITEPNSGATATFTPSEVTTNVTAVTVTNGGLLYSVTDPLTLTYIETPGGSPTLPSPSGTATVATLALGDETGQGYSVATYDLLDSGGNGSGAKLVVSLVDNAGGIRSSVLLADGENYTASTTVDVGSGFASVAKFNITTVSGGGGGGGGGGAGVDPVERGIANIGAQAITAACDFTGAVDFKNAATTFPAVPTGTPAPDSMLSLNAVGVLVKSTPPAPGAGADPVERAINNLTADGTGVSADCDFTGSCEFLSQVTRIGRQVQLFDTNAQTQSGIIRFSNTDSGTDKAGLSLYGGSGIAKPIRLHLTSGSNDDAVLSLQRDNTRTECILESKSTNDASEFVMQCTNNFPGTPVDHCVVRFRSQFDDVGTNTNECTMKYVPVQNDVNDGKLFINRELVTSFGDYYLLPHTTAPWFVAPTGQIFLSDGVTLATVGPLDTGSATLTMAPDRFLRNGTPGQTFEKNNNISVRQYVKPTALGDVVGYRVKLSVQSGWGGFTPVPGTTTPNGFQLDDITWGGSNIGLGGTRILQMPDAFAALMPKQNVDATAIIVPQGAAATAGRTLRANVRMQGTDTGATAAYKGGLYFRENQTQHSGTTSLVSNAKVAGNFTIQMEWDTWENPTAELTVANL